MNRIKQLRNEEGLTQKELAEAFNKYIYENNLTIKPTNQSMFSRWETGKSSPTKATYEALADYFDVLVPYLQGEIFKEDLDDEAQEMFEDVQDYISYVVPIRKNKKQKRRSILADMELNDD